WWAFHAQEGDFTTSGLNLIRQAGGTLAGPDVPYGDEKWLKTHGCRHGVYGWSGVMFPFAHLYNVQRGKSERVWFADWKLKSGDGLHLRLTVPSAEGVEVNICDGTSPAGGKPYEMKWIMLHNKGTRPAKTQVVSLIEPYRNEPIIRAARPLKLSGGDEAGFAAAACTLQLADRTDTILASADATQERTAEGGLTFAGRFGFYSEKDGEPLAMSLVGGTRLTKGKFGIRLETPEYRAKIIRVDRATETITVSPAPPKPAALVGAYVFITNPVRRSAHKVLEARAVTDGAELRLDLDSRIGTGLVTGVEDHKVKTSTPFVLQGFRYYHGARLVNAGRTAEYRLTEVASAQAAQIDKEAHPDAKADRLRKEFAAGTWFDIYDYGVGDELVWPCAASLTRVAQGVYRLVSPLPAKLALPAGIKVETKHN
ncbi:MAG: hypothetical protein N2689_16270, partial [Verrucomicrobiae bacterium]|nr:hypothetical protein [Verrucomicrobiae bacterium]